MTGCSPSSGDRSSSLALEDEDVVICRSPSHPLSASLHPGGTSQPSEQDEYSSVNISWRAESIKHVTLHRSPSAAGKERLAEGKRCLSGLLLLLVVIISLNLTGFGFFFFSKLNVKSYRFPPSRVRGIVLNLFVIKS